jgi:hypothetical protein
MTTQNIFLEFSKSKSFNTIIIPFNENILFNVKSSGLFDNNYFIANYKFTIDVQNLIIKDIFFISITKENNENSSNNFDITENNFEHNIHSLIKYFLEQSTVNIHNNNFVISFNLETINYYLMNINFDVQNNLQIINKNSLTELLISNKNIQTDIINNVDNNVDNNIKTDRSILRQIMWASLLSYTLNIFHKK